MSSKRIERIAAAADFFSLLKEAEELEKRARLLRRKAAKLRAEDPLLVNLDNRIDNFEEVKDKKRKADVEPKKEPKKVAKVAEKKKEKKVAEKPKEGTPDLLHYHTEKDGEQRPCRDKNCAEMEF
jgi:hypothetical protein